MTLLTSYKSKCHCQFGWYCKVNSKTNPSCLITKKDKLYPHTFKYSNYYSNHQADSNKCLFWSYRFNHDWHSKKQVKIHENKTKSIHLAVSSNQAWFVRISRFSLKIFARTVPSFIPSLKHVQISTSFSSNYSGHIFAWSWVYSIIKVKN